MLVLTQPGWDLAQGDPDPLVTAWLGRVRNVLPWLCPVLILLAGMYSGPKKLNILSHLNDLKADVASMQEIHLSKSADHLLCCSKCPFMYSELQCWGNGLQRK